MRLGKFIGPVLLPGSVLVRVIYGQILEPYNLTEQTKNRTCQKSLQLCFYALKSSKIPWL